MIRLIFVMMVVLLASVPAMAAGRACVNSDACNVLRSGHTRGRTPVACVSIPFVKAGYGQVAMFILREFNPRDTPQGIQEQLSHALFKDSKITGPRDDFCRHPAKFAGAKWVVICDEKGIGWITGASLVQAVRTGKPPGGKRVLVGTHVHE